ncbi:hypothetical protein [Sodalis sp. RH16]|uniref:hypothetical protein n=1 Tax=Sodalis sp. RH16 TaxID=3394331 RepID=UPI0039B63E66
MKRLFSMSYLLLITASMAMGYEATHAALLTPAAIQDSQGAAVAVKTESFIFRYLRVLPQHPNEYPMTINDNVLGQLHSGSKFILQAYPFGPPLSVLVTSTSVFNGIHRFTGDISSAELQHIGSFSITVSGDRRDTIGNININTNDFQFSTHNGRGTMAVINPDRQPVEHCYPDHGGRLLCR